jgi:GTP-dependent phosphoenolpyruvate carboxykinase
MLLTPGHTYHFDGIYDQGRDRAVTKFLVPKGEKLSQKLNQIDRDEGLDEILNLFRKSMQGKTMIVLFASLGPVNSVFSIPCVECTDSWYVAHSINILYRGGYEMFVNLPENGVDIFKFLHSAGDLDENQVSKNYDKKRIYIDYITNTVYSVNTQYAGNSVGFKKLALRLAIRKAHKEGWLAEHFMLIGVNGPNGRKTYFAGAFPSGCGKTSTAMLPGENILSDDLAFVRNIDGVARAVNVEKGNITESHQNTSQDQINMKFICAPRIKEGQKCKENETCDIGLYCSTDEGICKRLKKEGEKCGTDYVCDLGLICDREEKICKKPLNTKNRKPKGESCTKDDECQSSNCKSQICCSPFN